MLDGIPGALPGDAKILTDLAERKVIVVLLAQHLPLCGGKHLAIKIEQIAHFQILCHRSDLRFL